MIKKLTAKTQELNPKLPQYSNSFSKCIIIKPESNELLLKKGTIYTLFEISGESNFDTELISKVINDVIYNSYYQSESISPIQSMEKALVETREKVLQLSNDTLTSDPQNIKLNILSTVLWGNVTYTVQFGSAKSFLMKGGSINPLDMISEGNFSTSSKVVDEDEVLILCTDAFEKVFPPDILLSSRILESDLEQNQSCLLMRLLIDTSFSKDEEIDFGLGNIASRNMARERTEKVVKGMGSVLEKIYILLKNLFILTIPLWQKIKRMFPKRKATLFQRRVTQISTGRRGGSKGWIFLSAISILLAVSVFFTFKSKVFNGGEKKGEDIEEKAVNNSEQKQENTQPLTEDRSKDGNYKITRVTPEIFYDLKIADESADPTEIQIVGEKLIVVERARGKIYISDLDTPNLSMQTNTYPGIKSLSQTDGLLSFNDIEGYKTYSIETFSPKSSYKVDSLNLSFPYAGFIYSISDDILSKSSEKDGDLESVVWGQSPDFNNARSMAIAYSVYILKSDGSLITYAGGEKTDFSVSGIEKPFSDTVKVIADNDLTYIYVADKGNKSVVVLDEEGVLVKQYKNDKDGMRDDIRGLAVSSDRKLYLS